MHTALAVNSVTCFRRCRLQLQLWCLCTRHIHVAVVWSVRCFSKYLSAPFCAVQLHCAVPSCTAQAQASPGGVHLTHALHLRTLPCSPLGACLPRLCCNAHPCYLAHLQTPPSPIARGRHQARCSPPAAAAAAAELGLVPPAPLLAHSPTSRSSRRAPAYTPRCRCVRRITFRTFDGF